MMADRRCEVCGEPESGHSEPCLCMWSVDLAPDGQPFVKQLVIEDTVGGPGAPERQHRAIWRKDDGAYQVDVWTLQPGALAPTCQLSRFPSLEELAVIEAVRRRATGRAMADDSPYEPERFDSLAEQAERAKSTPLPPLIDYMTIKPGEGLEYGRAVKARTDQVVTRDCTVAWSPIAASTGRVTVRRDPDVPGGALVVPGMLSEADAEHVRYYFAHRHEPHALRNLADALARPVVLAAPDSLIAAIEMMERADAARTAADLVMADAVADLIDAAPSPLVFLSSPPTDDELVALADRLGPDGGERLYRLLRARGIRL